MNQHFGQIENSDWLTKQDRDDFAHYLYVYVSHIESYFGSFDWENRDFVYFCKENKIQQKGTRKGKKQENHFWFAASKPNGQVQNDFAHHFFRHIRNAFAHGLIEIEYKGKKRNKYYYLKDYDKNKVLSMEGRIRSDLLWKMMWLLFQNRK